MIFCFCVLILEDFHFFCCFFCLAFSQSITSAAKTISKSKIHHSVPDLALRPIFCPFLLVFGTTSCAFFRISMEAKLLDCFTWTPKMQLALFSVLFLHFFAFSFCGLFLFKRSMLPPGVVSQAGQCAPRAGQQPAAGLHRRRRLHRPFARPACITCPGAGTGPHASPHLRDNPQLATNGGCYFVLIALNTLRHHQARHLHTYGSFKVGGMWWGDCMRL